MDGRKNEWRSEERMDKEQTNEMDELLNFTTESNNQNGSGEWSICGIVSSNIVHVCLTWVSVYE